MGPSLRVAIKGYEGLYEISTEGFVYSLARWTGAYTKKEKILKPEITNDGYLRVVLCKNGETKRFSLHRIVAETFIENPENKRCVNHIDSTKSNNSIENLEWCTYAENVAHARKFGSLDVYNKTIPWETRLKVMEEYIPFSSDCGIVEVGEKLGIGKQTVSNIYTENTVLLEILISDGVKFKGKKYKLMEVQ